MSLVSEGKLFVIATPIGNLRDISARAIETLRSVDLIVCEDTRVSRRLLDRYGIDARVSSLHQHNEKRRIAGLLKKLGEGWAMGLISDAGTPVVSDPGKWFVAAAHEAGIRIVSISGPNAAVTALAGAGIDADRFVFEGFLPARRSARQTRLRQLGSEYRTMVFYEAPHRIVATLEDLEWAFGTDRMACVAKELSKINEHFFRAPLGQIRPWLTGAAERCKGEFVVVVSGALQEAREAEAEVRVSPERLLESLLQHLPARTAAKLVAEIGGGASNQLYKVALEVKDRL